jgi:hypothetical protein
MLTPVYDNVDVTEKQWKWQDLRVFGMVATQRMQDHERNTHIKELKITDFNVENGCNIYA